MGRMRLVDLPSLVRVGVVLAVVEVGLRVLPVARLARLLGVPLKLSAEQAPARAGPLSLPFRQSELRQVWLAPRVVRHWPFGPGPCLRESLVVGHALRRHHPSLRLGVSLDGEAMSAHAWLELDGTSLEPDRGYLTLGT